jgi:hypothetical protein
MHIYISFLKCPRAATGPDLPFFYLIFSRKLILYMLTFLTNHIYIPGMHIRQLHVKCRLYGLRNNLIAHKILYCNSRNINIDVFSGQLSNHRISCACHFIRAHRVFESIRIARNIFCSILTFFKNYFLYSCIYIYRIVFIILFWFHQMFIMATYASSSSYMGSPISISRRKVFYCRLSSSWMQARPVKGQFSHPIRCFIVCCIPPYIYVYTQVP